MVRSIRPSTPADAPAIVALFDETGQSPNAEPQHLHWKYWQARADWPGPRSFVVSNGSELIAHAAVVPGVCVWESRRVRMIQMIDWVARRAEPGAGVALLKHIGQQVEVLLSIGGGAETRRILPHVGFKSAGRAWGYVRALRPSRLLQSDAIPGWRRWPRFARSVAWTLAAPTQRTADWAIRRLVGEDIQRITPVLPVPARGMAVLERSVELFHYVLSCPIVPTALYAVERSGITRGYFLLTHAPGQVRLADCRMNSEDAADWRAMILCAIEQAMQDVHAAELVSVASDPMLGAALEGCGFHARFEIPVQVRSRSSDSMPPAPLRVQMLDSDAFFLHGRDNFWA